MIYGQSLVAKDLKNIHWRNQFSDIEYGVVFLKCSHSFNLWEKWQFDKTSKT